MTGKFNSDLFAMYVLTFPLLRTLYGFYGELPRDLIYMICVMSMVPSFFVIRLRRLEQMALLLAAFITVLLALRASDLSVYTTLANVTIDFLSVVSLFVLIKSKRPLLRNSVTQFAGIIIIMFGIASVTQLIGLYSDGVNIVMFREYFSYTNSLEDFGRDGIPLGNHSISSARVALTIIVLATLVVQVDIKVRLIAYFIGTFLLLVLFNKASIIAVALLALFYLPLRTRIILGIVMALSLFSIGTLFYDVTIFVVQRIAEGGGDRGAILERFGNNIDLNLFYMPFVFVNPYEHYFGGSSLYPHNFFVEFFSHFGVLGISAICLLLVIFFVSYRESSKLFLIIGCQLFTAGNLDFSVYFFSALATALLMCIIISNRKSN